MVDHGDMKNSEGYNDLTPHEAIENIERKERERKNQDYERVRSLIGTLLGVCQLAGFHVESRIVLRDVKTGKVWK